MSFVVFGFFVVFVFVFFGFASVCELGHHTGLAQALQKLVWIVCGSLSRSSAQLLARIGSLILVAVPL